ESEFANLEQLAWPFRSDLKYSAVFAQYFEEQLYFCMDALNTLYVGTTRAREVLWMLAPDPVGDKDVKELKSLDHIGKFLYKVLREAPSGLFDPLGLGAEKTDQFASIDRKSTRLNSSHVKISYAVFCLKKKK